MPRPRHRPQFIPEVPATLAEAVAAAYGAKAVPKRSSDVILAMLWSMPLLRRTR